MRIVICPDSFKGTLSSTEVCEAISAGWGDVRPDDDLVLLPLADGGEGTLDAVHAATPGSVLRSAGLVAGPDGRPVEGRWLRLPDGAAVVELASTSGLTLLDAPDPLGATTRGLGQVMREAARAGAREIVVGLGGSASTDGGLGALAGAGAIVHRDGGVDEGGGSLRSVRGIDTGPLRAFPPVRLLVDVLSPLCGPQGAAWVFGPQKGATPEQCALLDQGLQHLAGLLGGDPTLPGCGAAGGTGYGLAQGFGATVQPGAASMLDLAGVASALAEADLVITGEGRFDSQSGLGKLVSAVLAAAADAGVPARVIAGRVDADPGVPAVALATIAGSDEEAMRRPAHHVRAAARELAGALITGGQAAPRG
ncbi:glycerate kinase [Modestobacter sp. VKM Ac-2985]|uniref:glycerate kinase n=1 Tax=Modestobacter sp. VKM Ac-2985 TaxID=3004139 RepID=UPI0022ABB82E|nr:glycerate kinase [Modestobacter sp. VKM Ac-2985]MCZ2840157.1 glycerate kinase [Modestobacter sp. VKM Ac-2985]